MSTPKPPSLADRITCRYEGGPLDGRIAHHIARPKALAAPVLHRHTTCPKGENIDRTAAGMYRIEEREIIPFVSEPQIESSTTPEVSPVEALHSTAEGQQSEVPSAFLPSEAAASNTTPVGERAKTAIPPLQTQGELGATQKTELEGEGPSHDAVTKAALAQPISPRLFEFVAVHHPSKSDEDWHKVEN